MNEYVEFKVIFRFQPGVKNINDSIRDEFAKYGEIKSIERVNSISGKTDAKEAVDEDGAVAVYVTFVKSKSAYQAFMAHRKHHKFPLEAITILPSDSWRQGDTVIEVNESSNAENQQQQHKENVTELNNMVTELSMQNEQSAKKYPKLDIDIWMDGVTLIGWRQMVRKAKKDLEYVHLRFPFKTNDADNGPNCLSNDEYEKRLLQTISANCVGEHFEVLAFLGRDFVSKEMLKWMSTALNAVKSLIIVNQINSYILYALPKFCPNVRMLRLTGLWDGDCKDEEVQSWPSLKFLILTNRLLNLRCDSDDGLKFKRFIELNPQLDILLLDGLVDDDLVCTITDSLLVLKVLKFSRMSYSNCDLIMDFLIKINTLRTVMLTVDFVVQKDLKTITRAVQKLSQIRDIQLITLIQNYEPAAAAHEKFNHLTGFPIAEHRDCSCCNKKRVLHFSGLIPNLEIPEDLMVSVVVINTNNLVKSQDKSLETHILSTFDEMKTGFPNVLTLEVLKNDDHTVFVYVSSK